VEKKASKKPARPRRKKLGLKGRGERAKLLYFKDYDLVSIAAMCQMREEEVAWLSDLERWEDLKKLREDPKRVVKEYLEKQKTSILAISAELSLELLARYLYDWSLDVVNGTKIDVETAKVMVQILQATDKIKRLNDMQPTENLTVTGLTLAQAKLVLEQDPFLMDVKAEYKKLEDVQDTDGTDSSEV